MRLSVVVALFVLSVLPFSIAHGQESEGMPPTWDARTMLKELVEQTQRFEPLLEQVSTAGWGGSAEAYAGQIKALRDEIGYLQRAARELSHRPDTMTKTLEAFLRLQAIESMMDSVIEGVRRYQNPAVAELLQGVMNEVGPYGQSLQDYLVQLIGMKEVELKVANEEAQRCRSQLIDR